MDLGMLFDVCGHVLGLVKVILFLLAYQKRPFLVVLFKEFWFGQIKGLLSAALATVFARVLAFPSFCFFIKFSGFAW